MCVATISAVSLASHLREHVQILWFHTCDLQTAAGPQPVFKSRCKIPVKHHVFELAVRGEISTGSVWLFLILGQQWIKTHCTEPCSAAAAEENILENYATAPEKTPSKEGESFPKEQYDSCSFLWKPLSSLCLQDKHRSGVIPLSVFPEWSPMCVWWYLPLHFFTLPSLLCSYSHPHFWRVLNALTNAALCLSNLRNRKAANSEDQTLQILAAVMQQMKDFETEQLY